MFKILQKTVSTGTVTANYPAEPAKISDRFRGRPSFDFEKWKDARPAAEVCPTGAISLSDKGDSRKVTVDYGLCVFCGLCAEASSDQAVRITQEFELATSDRRNLVLTAEYTLNADRTHRALRKVDRQLVNAETDVEKLGQKARETIQKILGRSLAIREVDAGSCNGCEAGDCRSEQPGPRHRTLRNPLRCLSSSCRHAPGHRPGNAEHGTSAFEDASGDGGTQGSRRGRRLRHQWRHIRRKLRVSGKRRQGAAGGCLYSGMSTPATSSPARNSARSRTSG